MFGSSLPGFDILSGQGTTQVTVQVMDFAETGPVRLLYGKGACATSPDPYIVNPHGAYWQTVIDTLCTGTEYHENGFDVPIQDCPGFLTFAKRGRTVYGCDSVVTLHLYVYETPEVTLKTSDSVICQGGEVELTAWGSRTKYIPPEPPAVSIGDIFCEDGTIVKLKEYAAGNKKGPRALFFMWILPESMVGWCILNIKVNPASGESILITFLICLIIIITPIPVWILPVILILPKSDKPVMKLYIRQLIPLILPTAGICRPSDNF